MRRIKLNKRYKLKIIQAYAPTTSYDDQQLEQFYEDIELAIKKVQTQYTVVMEDFNAKVGTKQSGEQAIIIYGVGRRNNRGEMLVEFAERNQLRIINTSFKKHKNRKWTWHSSNGETKNEIDFIMCGQQSRIQETEVVGKIKCSDHRLVRAKIVLDLKKTRTKLFTRKKCNVEVIRSKNEEFKVVLSNKFEALGENGDDLEEINKTITETILETVIEAGGKTTKQATSKLPHSTKDFIKTPTNESNFTKR